MFLESEPSWRMQHVVRRGDHAAHILQGNRWSEEPACVFPKRSPAVFKARTIPSSSKQGGVHPLNHYNHWLTKWKSFSVVFHSLDLVIQTLFINLNIFSNILFKGIQEEWLTPKASAKIQSNCLCCHSAGWKRSSFILALLPGWGLFLLMPRYLPNYSQVEVNRQNSTSSALSFLRWVEDESLRDDRKKAAECVAPQFPFLSFSVALNVSFIQARSKTWVPLVAQNQIGQPNAEMHVTHTMWVHSFLCTSAESQKTQSQSANDLCQAITEAEHPHSCLSVHFVRNQIKKQNKTRIEQWKWDPDQNWCV